MLEQLGHRIATVRTLDFGGDKTPPFLAEATGGPLGPRGIRLALAAAEGVAPQLRALLRVSGDAVLRVLVPMVTDPAEIDAVRAIAVDARDAVAPDAPDPMIGAMIEVPAAALMARRLSEACDFLSIGTNDLTQYALAADRQNPGAFNPVAHHPAVLRLIARTIAAAHSAGILVDVCGEAAGDPELLPLLVALGVDELSVSPARIAQTRRYVRSLSTQRAKVALVEALAARTADEVGAAAPGCARRRATRESRGARRWRREPLRPPGPTVTISTAAPPSAPSASTCRMLLAFALRSFAFRTTVASSAAAARTRLPAGRACKGTPAGSVTVRRSSELSDNAGLLRRRRDRRQVSSRGGQHRRGHRALDERRVGQANVDPVQVTARQDRLHAQHGAADVDQHDDARAGVRSPDRGGDPVGVRAQPAVAGAPRWADANVLTADLPDQVCKPFCERRGVGDQYNPDHRSSPFIQRSILHCRTGFGKSGT